MTSEGLPIFEGIELKAAFVALIARHCYYIPDPGEVIALAFRLFTLVQVIFQAGSNVPVSTR